MQTSSLISEVFNTIPGVLGHSSAAVFALLMILASVGFGLVFANAPLKPQSEGANNDVESEQCTLDVAASDPSDSDDSGVDAPLEDVTPTSAAQLYRNFGDSEPFSELIYHWAKSVPDRKAFTWLGSSGRVDSIMTYAELHAKVLSVAAQLQEDGLHPGQRVLLCFPPSLDFIVAFFACLVSGIVAVPVYPPQPAKLDTDVPRLLGVMRDCGAKRVLTCASYRRNLMLLSLTSKLVHSTWASLSWFVVGSSSPTTTKSSFKVPRLSHRAVAFLQYTSGSTSKPKGVVVTRGALLHNIMQIHVAFRHGGSDGLSSAPKTQLDFLRFFEERHAARLAGPDAVPIRAMSWLPTYHDMGLIGFVIAPTLAGVECVHTSPLSFIAKPTLWLEAVSKYRCNITAAPNFAFELAVRKTPTQVAAALKLGHVETFLSGAEPIRPSTVRAFFAHFHAAGARRTAFFPAYGLAEAVLFVTGRGTAACNPTMLSIDASALEVDRVAHVAQRGTGYIDTNDVRELVGCGFPAPSLGVKVVVASTHGVKTEADVKGKCDKGASSTVMSPCEECTVGEILVSSGSESVLPEMN